MNASAPVAEVIRMWEEVLGIEDIGENDDFFELGGTSIAAIRLVPLLEDRFGVDVDVTLVFDAATPAALASRLR